MAAHATGVGQAVDIGMLIAGGVFFGMDAFTIFKDIAGFANAVNAQNEDDLEIAGQHLASAVAKIGVDALMTLLTSKVAKKIAGMEEPGTTTGDMDDVNRSIRKTDPNDNSNQIYDIEDIGDEIVNNSIATEAYKRITDEGYDIRISHDRPNEPGTAGITWRYEKNVDIYEMNNFNVEDVVGTMVHESVHVEYRNRRRIPNNTQYEEYKAFVREEIYRRSKNPNVSTKLSLNERRILWETVKKRYPDLPQGKYPFGGSVTND